MNQWRDTMNRRYGMAGAAVTLAIGAVAWLTGCTQEVPIVSKESRATIMTLDEQRIWVGEQFDAAILASEVPDGWRHSSSSEVRWADDYPEDRAKTLNSLLPRGCDGTAGRLDVTLINNDAPDPFAVAERVRVFWESEGWTVADIRDYAPEGDPYFRADREDGAFLSLEAQEGGVALSVRSACSSHNTVTSWEHYLDEPGE